MSIDTTDSFRSHTQVPVMRHPGQAVKIVTESSGDHRVIGKDIKNEVCIKKVEDTKTMKSSKSCSNFEEIESKQSSQSRSDTNLKESKSCDENLIKFIFTKHGIQVISDVETIV